MFCGFKKFASCSCLKWAGYLKFLQIYLCEVTLLSCSFRYNNVSLDVAVFSPQTRQRKGEREKKKVVCYLVCVSEFANLSGNQVSLVIFQLHGIYIILAGGDSKTD